MQKNHFGSFLQLNGHSAGKLVHKYNFQHIKLPWDLKPDEHDLDCGVYVMSEMKDFLGLPYECPNLMQPSRRILLRAEICASLLLSDKNLGRSNLLEAVDCFSKNKHFMLKDLKEKVEKEAKKKAVEEAKKKDVAEAKKKAVEEAKEKALLEEKEKALKEAKDKAGQKAIENVVKENAMQGQKVKDVMEANEKADGCGRILYQRKKRNVRAATQ